jgi:hypothetical protein
MTVSAKAMTRTTTIKDNKAADHREMKDYYMFTPAPK